MSRLSTGFANEPETLADRVVTLASQALLLEKEKHANRTLIIGAASASIYTVTMPHANGSGDVYHFYVPLAKLGSGAITITLAHGVSSNAYLGNCWSLASNATIVQFAAAAADGMDLITLNGTTTGAADPGDYIVLQDIAVGTWQVLDMRVSTSGVQATPFSAP